MPKAYVPLPSDQELLQFCSEMLWKKHYQWIPSLQKFYFLDGWIAESVVRGMLTKELNRAFFITSKDRARIINKFFEIEKVP